MKSTVPVFIPIETNNRELDYMLMIAVALSDLPLTFYLGVGESILSVMERTNSGIFLGKGANSWGDFPYLSTIRDNGHRLIHCDTEGAIYPGGPDRWREILLERLSVEVLQRDDRVCAWGDFQVSTYTEYGVHDDQILATGHPLFDLYQDDLSDYFDSFEDVVKDVVETPFVLINTNFTRANNTQGLEYTISEACGYKPNSRESVENTIQRWADQTRRRSRFVEAIHMLSFEFPNLSFVVRPHPSEDRRDYHLLFRGRSNIKVAHVGPVGPWLLRAQALIHDGCTTAVEAWFAGTPVINFRPSGEGGGSYLPNSLGQVCTTIDEISDALRRPECEFEDGLDPLARSLLANFDGPSRVRFRTLFEEIIGEHPLQSVPDEVECKADETIRRMTDVALLPLRLSTSTRRASWRHRRNKFPGFLRDDIHARVARLSRCLRQQTTAQFFGPGLITVSSAYP